MGKFTRLDGRSTPPIIPINWADWEGDEHVADMDETMEGIYFRIVRELWKYDQFEFNYTRLADRLRIKDSRRVRSFLERWGHLFRCVECHGVVLPAWKHASDLQQSCSDLAAVLQQSCSYCADLLQCSCSNLAVFVQHDKLKNYKKQALSGSRLFPIQSKAIQSNSSQAKLNGASDENPAEQGTSTSPFDESDDLAFDIEGEDDAL